MLKYEYTDLLSYKGKVKQQMSESDEAELEYSKAVERLFSTEDGVFVCRELVKQIGLFDFRDGFKTPDDRTAQDAMQRMYTRFIRRYLSDDTIHKIERKIK